MSDGSKIEWTDATWQPITGCSIVSLGCNNCYAMRLAATRLQHHPSRAGLTKETKVGPVWNGIVRFNDKWLDQPLRWKNPRRIFVCAHGDLFHENVPDEWIDKVFAVMALAPQHTFQVLTKRSARMRAYLTSFREDGQGFVTRNGVDGYRSGTVCFASDRWPLPNVWLGVSAERQQEADERIPDLLATPAAVRFISAEPLLGPLDLRNFLLAYACNKCRRTFVGTRFKGGGIEHIGCKYLGEPLTRLDWVIVGGESGPHARIMDPIWAELIRMQCRDAGVAFFMKQMTAKKPIPVHLFVREMPQP